MYPTLVLVVIRFNTSILDNYGAQEAMSPDVSRMMGNRRIADKESTPDGPLAFNHGGAMQSPDDIDDFPELQGTV